MELGKFRRVNGTWMEKSVGQTVALVGKVLESHQGTSVVLQTSVRRNRLE